MNKAIFLDRDGTINAGIPKYERVDRVDKVEILPFVIDGLRKIASLDYLVFFVTNQAGLAEGLITKEQFDQINQKVLDEINPSGIRILKTYICPHGEGSECDCRKPKPGLLLQAAKDYDIDLHNSWMVGDRQTDIDTGLNAGTKSILVQTGSILTADGATYIAANLEEAANFITANSE